jgi:hypothetical protein
VDARLKVGRFDKTVSVREADKEVSFEVDLSAGEQRIQTWFTMESGEKIAAYYTYIEPVPVRGQTPVRMKELASAASTPAAEKRPEDTDN